MRAESAIERLNILIAHATMMLEPDAMTGATPRDVTLVLDRLDVSALKTAVEALKKQTKS